MTQEEKQLLLKDICARLPYHVRVKVWLKDGDTEEGHLDLQHNYGDVLLDAFYYNKITKIKPYLRPLASMTEEEWKVFEKLTCGIEKFTRPTAIMCMSNAIHFLAMKYIDYNGLIEKGLAIEAPEGMYEN